jgi:hypothetical protein
MAEKTGVLEGFLGFSQTRLRARPDFGPLVSPRYEVAMGKIATFWDGKGAGQE